MSVMSEVGSDSIAFLPLSPVLVAKLRPLGETVGLSRARTSGESPDSTQAARGPQWPTQLAVSMRREALSPEKRALRPAVCVR
jgi:hypothetical protein